MRPDECLLTNKDVTTDLDRSIFWWGGRGIAVAMSCPYFIKSVPEKGRRKDRPTRQ